MGYFAGVEINLATGKFKAALLTILHKPDYGLKINLANFEQIHHIFYGLTYITFKYSRKLIRSDIEIK